MTQLTAVQVAGYWVGAGGPKSRAVEWVAIAIGESGLDDAAVSPVGAVGLWQIMPFNAPTYGYGTADLYDPGTNARIAVAMSGGGTNCAAWDSAYANIYASGRYTFLAWPEQGSADYNNLAVAQAELSGHGLTGITPPAYPGIDDSLELSVSRIQKIGDLLIPAQSLRAVQAIREIDASFRRGWRA